MRLGNMVTVLFLAFFLAACGANEGVALKGTASSAGTFGTEEIPAPGDVAQVGLLAAPEQRVQADDTIFEYGYLGAVQTFTAPFSGDYLLEVWGAQGGNDPANPTTVFGGRGGYAKGVATLTAGTTLYVYVGSQGTGCLSSGWNSTGGGGATDIRLVGGDWKDEEGLYSRIIVAGGGGGRHGQNYEDATYVGNDGGGEVAPTYDTQGVHVTGATQTGSGTSNYGSSVVPGSFGYANPGVESNTCSAGGYNGGERGSDNWAHGGAGGGWYGGIQSWPAGSGGSGYVLTDASYKPIGYTPGETFYMFDTALIAGNGSMPDPAGGTVTGREGNGFARIALLSLACPGSTPDPTDVTATPATVDFGDTAQLNATTSGTTIKWYTEASGGAPIGETGSGEDFEVSPTKTTTYYAEASGTPSTQTRNFYYSGAVKTWTVPAGITSIQIETWGAAGWSGNYSGGKGGYAKGTLAVTPGETLYLYVGGQGAVADVPYAPMGGGWNGGGHGQTNDNGPSAGGGGGASDVRIGGTELANRIIVAGGGGGSTDNDDCWGGDGGGEIGADGGCGSEYEVGTGGTQSEGGTIGGVLGRGGSAKSFMTPWNGGGGGGYYGGGTSPAHGSGGGGSSYIGGVVDGETATGVRSGHGQITITYTDVSIEACPSNRVPVTVTVGSYAFTNCGQTGSTGPVQDQCDTAYTGTPLAGAVTIDTQGIQEWVVPVSGTYRIEAYGAQGGDFITAGIGGEGGKGAVIKGDFSLVQGQIIKILVGQRGTTLSDFQYGGAGGAGGTFVVSAATDTLLMAAGGGSGAAGGDDLNPGDDGSASTDGNAGIARSGTSSAAAGGTAGGKGALDSTYTQRQDPGAGYLESSTALASYGTVTSAKSFAEGGEGQTNDQAYYGSGGFGGGSAGNERKGGAAGGYSGGGTISTESSASDFGVGGGGGSYNDGANQDNVAGANAGDGKVVITSLCINLSEPTDVIAKPVSLSSGESVQLNATTVPGSMIVWYTDETGGVSIGSSPSGEDFEVSPTAETTYYAEAVPAVLVEGTVDFDYTGDVQTWTVPAGVTSIDIEAWGAQGGGGSSGFGAGGKGGYASGTVAVIPGQTLYIYVGQQGFQADDQIAFNGGGSGSIVSWDGNAGDGYTGGGASHVAQRTGLLQDLSSYTTDIFLVAAGGGGAGGAYGWSFAANGGDGGGIDGLAGESASGRPGGGGGSQVSGGTSADARIAAGFGIGASGSSSTGDAIQGGGGGGGLYGGGAGRHDGGGGGGGSSYIGGVTDGETTAGLRTGNGRIVITYLGLAVDPTGCPSKRVPVTVSMCDARVDAPTVIATPETIASGASSLLNATATGTTISWYAEEFGGVAIGTSASGEDFEVFPTATTTYYAEASDADPTHCPSLRVPVTVTIKAAPGEECGSNDDCIEGYCTDGVCCGVESCDDGNVCTVDSCAVAGDGTCTNAAGNAGTECRGAAGPCDAVEVCDGIATDCPEDVLVTADTNTECRVATGACDVAEICNGFLIDCPDDGVATTDVVCRPQDGLCDVADNCDGETAECPVYDAVATADVVCRSKDGDCDLDDNCDGTTKGCTEKFVEEGTECRAIAGVCDVAEKCTGAASDCPVDAFAGSSTVCRVSVGICDASEYCSGDGVSCPAENYASVNGDTCDDGDILTENDVCLDGGCAGELRTGICGNEMTVGALPYTVSGDTGGRLNTLETYGTACANADQPTSDIVYALDVTEGVEYQIQVIPAEGFDAALNLLNVCGESEICIGAANAGTDGATEVILYTADHTGTIYIAVEGGGAGEAGAFELNVAVVEQSDDDTIVTDDVVTDDITTDEIAGDSDELSGDSDELLVDADEVVTDEVVTDETVTDNETPDETTDETVTDNETPDETADEAGDGLVTDEDDLLTDETLTDTDKPADEACSCSMVF